MFPAVPSRGARDIRAGAWASLRFWRDARMAKPVRPPGPERRFAAGQYGASPPGGPGLLHGRPGRSRVTSVRAAAARLRTPGPRSRGRRRAMSCLRPATAPRTDGRLRGKPVGRPFDPLRPGRACLRTPEGVRQAEPPDQEAGAPSDWGTSRGGILHRPGLGKGGSTARAEAGADDEPSVCRSDRAFRSICGAAWGHAVCRLLKITMRRDADNAGVVMIPRFGVAELPHWASDEVSSHFCC